MINVYNVTVAKDQMIRVESRGLMVDAEGNLIFKNSKDGGIVAIFAANSWQFFEKVDELDDE